MSKTRLEAFSDGVIAILITIMVLELRPPVTADAAKTLRSALPAYVLSFLVVAIYWNNHHHMMHLCTRVNGRILWANMHLLFWLSLIPFATAWLSEENFTHHAWPAAVYGGVTFMAGISWLLLKTTIIADQGPDSKLKAAYGNDWKGVSSGLLTFASIWLAFVHPYITIALQVIVVLTWIIPDTRIERRYGH